MEKIKTTNSLLQLEGTAEIYLSSTISYSDFALRIKNAPKIGLRGDVELLTVKNYSDRSELRYLIWLAEEDYINSIGTPNQPKITYDIENKSLFPTILQSSKTIENLSFINSFDEIKSILNPIQISHDFNLNKATLFRLHFGSDWSGCSIHWTNTLPKELLHYEKLVNNLIEEIQNFRNLRDS